MSLYLTRNKDLTSPSYFDEDYLTILERDMTIYSNTGTRMDPSQQGLNGLIYRIGWIRSEDSSFSNLIAKTTGPNNISSVVDRLAKSFESIVLTDLG
jgi:hypothetical protein